MNKNIALDKSRLARMAKERVYLTDALLFDVSRATDATTLLTYRRDTVANGCLDAIEKDEICRAIEKRFAFLNVTAASA